MDVGGGHGHTPRTACGRDEATVVFHFVATGGEDSRENVEHAPRQASCGSGGSRLRGSGKRVQGGPGSCRTTFQRRASATDLLLLKGWPERGPAQLQSPPALPALRLSDEYTFEGTLPSGAHRVVGVVSETCACLVVVGGGGGGGHIGDLRQLPPPSPPPPGQGEWGPTSRTCQVAGSCKTPARAKPHLVATQVREVHSNRAGGKGGQAAGQEASRVGQGPLGTKTLDFTSTEPSRRRGNRHGGE